MDLVKRTIAIPGDHPYIAEGCDFEWSRTQRKICNAQIWRRQISIRMTIRMNQASLVVRKAMRFLPSAW